MEVDEDVDFLGGILSPGDYQVTDANSGSNNANSDNVAKAQSPRSRMPCPHCDSTFREKRYLNRHLKEKHPNLVET